MSIKVLSWNIWYDGNLEKVNKFLEESNADIIGLQEVMRKGSDIQLSEHLLKDLGYNIVYSPVFQIVRDVQTIDIGNAILSKYPIGEHKTHNLSEKENRVAIEATVTIDDKPFQIVCTHLFHAHLQASEIQDTQAENLVKILSETDSILMGDFNALPESNAIKIISKKVNNTDTKSLPTWSVYSEGCKVCEFKGILYKFDNIFISKNLKRESYQVEDSDASDHLPISAVIEI